MYLYLDLSIRRIDIPTLMVSHIRIHLRECDTSTYTACISRNDVFEISYVPMRVGGITIVAFIKNTLELYI